MNATEIQALLDAKSGIGGVVELPAGNHTLQALTGSRSLDIPSGVTLRGQNREACILTVDAGAEAHAINMISVASVAIENLTIEGNGATHSTNVHLIRGDGIAGLGVRNVTLRNSKAYSIGLQEGTFTDVIIDGVLIEDSGNDGIDTKNKNDDNARNVIRNVTVDGYNILSGITDKAGIDLRGPWTVEDCEVIGVPHDCVGIRGRQGELLDVNGLGAHNSVIRRCTVTGTGAANSWGIQAIARDVSVYNCTMSDVAVGGIAQELRALFQDCAAVDCLTAGFQSTTSGSPYFGDDMIVRRCTSSGAPIGFHAEGQDRMIIDQCSGDQVTVATGATATMIVGPAITLSDSGTGTVQYVGSDASWQTECSNGGLTAAEYRVTAVSTAAVLCKVLVWVGRRPCWITRSIAPAAALSTAVAPMLSHKTALGASAT